MTTNTNTNDISKIFKTLDDIIERINNNNNQNTRDTNLVTHLQSIRDILSKLEKVPGTLKQIPIGFQEKLKDLKKTCNTYDYNNIGNSEH